MGGTIYVEEYDRKLNYISSRAIEAELELFGGYYTDGKYHFIVFGQANDEEDNNKEIMRIVLSLLNQSAIVSNNTPAIDNKPTSLPPSSKNIDNKPTATIKRLTKMIMGILNLTIKGWSFLVATAEDGIAEISIIAPVKLPRKQYCKT